MEDDIFDEVISYLNLKTIVKHFEIFSNENLIIWLNGISDEDLKRMDTRELWRRVQEKHKSFILQYFERLNKIYNEMEMEKIMKKWLRFFFKFEKIVILKILIKWNIKLFSHYHLSVFNVEPNLQKEVAAKLLSRWIEDSIREKKSEKFIDECILLQKEIVPIYKMSAILLLSLIKYGYFKLFAKYYPQEKEDRKEMFEDLMIRREISISSFFGIILSDLIDRTNSLEKKRNILRIIFSKMELEEGDLNLSKSYYQIMQLLEIDEEGLYRQFQKETILLPESFVTDFLKQHWNQSTKEISPSHLRLLDFILHKMEKRPKFQYPEDNQLHNDIQDNMYMILKIFKDGPKPQDALTILEFFATLYHDQLFKVYENEEKKRSFRFIDSMIDFMISHEMFDGIPILQNLGYEMKMEHYLFVMTKYKQDLQRVMRLYELKTPFSHVVMEYAATHGYFDLVKFYHENGCAWDSKTLYGACKSLNFELIEYCFKEGCEWDPRTIYLFNPYFSKQALEREDLNIYRQKIQYIFTIIKKYAPPIELEEIDQNKSDIKKNEQNEKTD